MYRPVVLFYLVVSLGKTRETREGDRRGTRDARPREARDDGKEEEIKKRERLPFLLLSITPRAPLGRASLVN